jgi:hypothetical protein
MTRRARVLHGLMKFIHRRAEHGKMLALYTSAASRFNRSIYALEKGKVISADSIRYNYARWRAAGCKADIFSPRWRTIARRLISPEQADIYARRMVSESISPTELYRRLQAESGPLYFSLYTLRNSLPCAELARLAKVKREMASAELALTAALPVAGERIAST